MQAPKVFQFIGDMVTETTNSLVQPAVVNLMSDLKTTTVTCVTLYIVLNGYAIATGLIESPFGTFVKQCLKIIFIAYFALTADGYTNSIVEAIDGLENGLSQAVSQAKSVDGKQPTIYQTLDQSLDKGFELVETCAKKAQAARWTAVGTIIGWYVAAFLIAISAVYVNVLGGTTIIVAKFSLTVMFALGPLFIVCLMFPVTARFFENWFSQVLNYVLTIVIMVIIMAFAIKAYDSFITGTDFGSDHKINPMSVAFQVCAVSGILGWIILQAGSMASGLAGGLSMAAMSLRQFAAPAIAAANTVKTIGKLLNPQKTRPDLNTGRSLTASRASHLLAGNTVLNPAYRQHIKENLGKNWGSAKGGTIKNK